ncbi:14 kDa phosphohistidine phosphatase [Homalodisca vitripennis]|nr:14 kDa phosphohistidine phosphatase [Homalodisca vitripennis]
MTLESLEKVPNVEIDPEGVFKYILIKVYAKQTRDGNEPSKMIVRGNARGPYHVVPPLHSQVILLPRHLAEWVIRLG